MCIVYVYGVRISCIVSVYRVRVSCPCIVSLYRVPVSSQCIVCRLLPPRQPVRASETSDVNDTQSVRRSHSAASNISRVSIISFSVYFAFMSLAAGNYWSGRPQSHGEPAGLNALPIPQDLVAKLPTGKGDTPIFVISYEFPLYFFVSLCGRVDVYTLWSGGECASHINVGHVI